jgi:transposase
MRPKGSTEKLEVRRQIAGRLLQEGLGIRHVARLVEASPSSVFQWKQMLENDPQNELKAKPHRHVPPRLTPDQKQKLLTLLQAGPLTRGFPTDL